MQAALEAGVDELPGECGLEWIADGGDVRAFEDLEQRAGDGGEEMRVLVGVDVGDGDAGMHEASDLGVGFAHDVLFTDLTEEESTEEGDERGAEGFTVGAYEGRDLFGRRGGGAVGEDDVTADAEGRVGVGENDGVVEGGASGHEGSGGEGAGLVEFED